MQRLAQGFGFTTMAMYRYVASKDDLQQLMLDAVIHQMDGRSITRIGEPDSSSGCGPSAPPTSATRGRWTSGSPWRPSSCPDRCAPSTRACRAMRSLCRVNEGRLHGGIDAPSVQGPRIRDDGARHQGLGRSRRPGHPGACRWRSPPGWPARRLQPLIASGGFFGDGDGMEPGTGRTSATIAGSASTRDQGARWPRRAGQTSTPSAPRRRNLRRQRPNSLRECRGIHRRQAAPGRPAREGRGSVAHRRDREGRREGGCAARSGLRRPGASRRALRPRREYW